MKKNEAEKDADTTTHGSIPAKNGRNDEDRTSGDCINRQQAINMLKELTANGTNKGMISGEDAVHRIEMLPSAQPEQQWIPCGERLPQEGEVVLTQAKFKDNVKMAVSSRIDYNYWTTWGTRDINIVAWMPLPEPARLEND